MNKFKAVFLDRDGTISRKNIEMFKKRDQYMGQLIGKDDFHLSPELYSKMFNKVSEEYIDLDDVTTLEIEEAFWKKWYRLILLEYGVTKDLEAICDDLYDKFSFHRMKKPYDETIELLKYLKDNGYKIGVISDTFPSLEKSIESMGISKYIDVCISSSQVGVMKPDPKIYKEGLKALNVEAGESIFVDDSKTEADGARDLGFTSFYLDRKQGRYDKKPYTIEKLTHLIEYLEK